MIDAKPKSDLVVPCPQCKKPVKWHTTPYRPFCSQRCRTLDRGAWASEDYVISQPTENSSSASEDQSDS